MPRWRRTDPYGRRTARVDCFFFAFRQLRSSSARNSFSLSSISSHNRRDSFLSSSTSCLSSGFLVQPLDIALVWRICTLASVLRIRTRWSRRDVRHDAVCEQVGDHSPLGHTVVPIQRVRGKLAALPHFSQLRPFVRPASFALHIYVDVHGF